MLDDLRVTYLLGTSKLENQREMCRLLDKYMMDLPSTFYRMGSMMERWQVQAPIELFVEGSQISMGCWQHYAPVPLASRVKGDDSPDPKIV